MNLLDYIQFQGYGGGGGESGRSTMPAHGHPEKQFGRKYKGGKDKGGVQGQSAGTQTTGSSRIARKYRVIDHAGREIHRDIATYEEAHRMASGNSYARVISYVPESDTQKVRTTARKQLVDKGHPKIARRSLAHPDVQWYNIM